MRVRVAATTFGITVALLAVPACSTSTTESSTGADPSSRARKQSTTVQNTPLLSSAALEARLLDERDLGSGYLREPEHPSRHDDVTVLGCPALNKLGGDAATGATLAFPRKAKTAFTYARGNNSEVSEELYSDSPTKLSAGVGRIFDAMTGCPAYRIVAGGTAIDVASQKPPVRGGLGNERWSQLLTFTTAGRSTVVKQTAVRDGSVLLIVSGSPALVDRHLDKALTKATATS
ncbi:hypothetical protein [Streptomyces sp. NPDC004682]